MNTSEYLMSKGIEYYFSEVWLSEVMEYGVLHPLRLRLPTVANSVHQSE